VLAPSHRGFTLIELLVGITILGVLLALGAPALGTYLQNSKVANAANVYFGAVQTARTEAIRRNVLVEFVPTNSTGDAATLATGAVADPAGANWVVRAASGVGGHEPVEIKGGGEGDAGITVLVTGPTADGTIGFNGFGAPVVSGTYSIDITNPTAGACAAASGPSGPIRCRRVTVSAAGRVGSCDPAASAVAGDSRAC
jgi:type IV fimbrial biogenesis protein FimT